MTAIRRRRSGLVGRPLGQALLHDGELLVGVVEEHRLLRGEVTEEGAGGDVGAGRDVVDRGRREAVLGEELDGRGGERGAGAVDVSLAERGAGGRHGREGSPVVKIATEVSTDRD